MEDDANLRAFYRAALAMAGYDVLVARDGIDALQQIEASPPDAVILDLNLPRLGGEDVGAELRARADLRNVAIVVVTGTPYPAHPQFECVLRKPVTAESLIDTLENCLRQSARRRRVDVANGDAGDVDGELAPVSRSHQTRG